MTDSAQPEDIQFALDLSRKQIEQLSVGVAVLSCDGKIFQINPCLAQYLGYDPADLLNVDWEFLIHPDERSSEKPDYLKPERLKNGPYRVRRRFIGAHDQIIWADFSAEDLGLQGLVQVVWEDVTDERAHDLQIDQDQAILQALISSLDDMVFLFSESGEIIRSWGRKTSAFSGYADQLVGRSLEQLFDSELCPMFRNAFAVALQSKIPQRIEYPSFQTQIWYEATISSVEMPHGEFGVSMMLKNISRRKSAEIDLRRFQEGLKTLNQISYEVDSSFPDRVQQGLDLMLHYFYMQVAQVVKFDKENFEIVEQIFRRENQPAAPADWERELFPLIKKSGGILVIHDLEKEAPALGLNDISHFPFNSYIGALIRMEQCDCGQVSFYADTVYATEIESNDKDFMRIVARWISFVLEQELYTSRLLALNENKDRILDLIAHDLRNPLGAISGLAEYTYNTDKDELSEHVKVALSGIIRASDRAQELLEALLRTERFEARREPLNRVPIPFKELIQNVWIENLQQAAQFQLTLKTELQDNAFVNVDTVWMNRALENLVSNSLKFTPEGGNIILKMEAQADHVTCTVEDTGLDIDEDMRPHLFQKFTEAKRLGVHGESTTGLGLYLVKHIIEQHDGKIWFEPNPEGGSRFIFTLPTCQQDAHPVVEREAFR